MLSPRAALMSLVALALLACPAPSARAQDGWTAGFDDEMLTLSAPDGTVVISPNRHRVVNNFEGRHSVRLIEQPGGVDLRVDLHNPTTTPIDCGTLIIGGLRLADRINYYDMTRDAHTVVWDSHGGRFVPRDFKYPEQTYSPVSVFGDDRYTVGVSILYPILEYEHPVWMQAMSPGGMYTLGGANWEQRFQLAGQLAPGETRTYILTIRVVPAGESWLKTLTPYRDYFNGLYGGVQYTRDPRPVLTYVAAQGEAISPDNPYGFFQPRRRPDIHGWKPTADYLREKTSEGWRRVMIWTPTGLFRNNQHNNFPFLFMTQMRHVAPMNASMGELRRLADDMQVGYWWGRSQQVMQSWDTPDSEVLDPDNPDHVRRALAELDLAVALGATTIGLDAFFHMDDWDAYRWLQTMREHAPTVTFITEPARADFLHTLAPTFIFASRGQARTPKILADFLLPGHETWGLIKFSMLEEELGRTMSEAERRAEVERVAALGYVPVFGDLNVNPADPAFQAAETWRTTVPRDLRAERVGAGGPDDPGHADGTRAVRSSTSGAPDPDRPGARPTVVLAGSAALPNAGDTAASEPEPRRFTLRGFQRPNRAPPSPAADRPAQVPLRFVGRPAAAHRSAPLAPFTPEQAAEALDRVLEHTRPSQADERHHAH